MAADREASYGAHRCGTAQPSYSDARRQVFLRPRTHPMHTTSPRRLLALTSLPLIAACADSVDVAPVLLDGVFSEWAQAAQVLDDPADAPDAAIDIRSIRGLDEGPWLFLSIDLGREVNAQSLPGTLHLLVDADDDPSTGEIRHGMHGVDIGLDVSQRRRPLVAGRGSGFSLSAFGGDDGLVGVTSHALRVTVAPTWSASRFELRMSRLGGSGFRALGGRIRLKAVYVEGEDVADETEVGVYEFRTAPSVPAPGVAGRRLARTEGSVRVAQWNVAGRSFAANPESFARILGALAPDVVLMDEAPPSITPESMETFFNLPPLRTLGEWRFVLGRTGGRQRTVVAARERGIRPAETMQTLHYPAGVLDELGHGLPEDFGRLLEAEQERGLSATGAWVDVGGTEVLFVPVDLQSAGWAGSPHDRLRDLQARTLRDRVLVELGGASAPVVIGGDLNLVGSPRPLGTLIEGLDTDGSDLHPVDARRLGERTYATWRNAEGLFAPGRLDFLLVPDAAVEVDNAFVFATEDLNRETLNRLGLAQAESRVSDHLPVVADLRIR